MRKTLLHWIVLGVSLTYSCGAVAQLQAIDQAIAAQQAQAQAQQQAAQGLITDTNMADLQTQINNQVSTNQTAEISTGLYGPSPLVCKSTDPIQNDFLHWHFDLFCSSSDNILSAFCGGTTCSKSLPNADLSVANFLNTTALVAGNGVGANTLTAAQRFMVNLIDNPNPPLINTNVSSLKNSPDQQKALVRALAGQAMLSVAREPFAEMVAKRSTFSNHSETMMQMMERIGTTWLFSTQWGQSMAKAYAAAIANNDFTQATTINMAMMEAYLTWMQYQQYRQLERIEALLATLVVQNQRASEFGQTLVPPPPQ